ncbi:MAG: DUF3050 domain-containing protein, partial [Bacteriovorax sp.]
MDELGARSDVVKKFIADRDFNILTKAQRNFVEFNLDLAKNGKIHEVAAAFFFGREKLIPDMFTTILEDLEKNITTNDQRLFPSLKFYLERHIEIDGGEHSHSAHHCLHALCGNDELKWKEAKLAGINSLKLRSTLWDEVESCIS